MNLLLIIAFTIFIFKDKMHFKLPSLPKKIKKEPAKPIQPRKTSTALGEYIEECRSRGQNDEDIRQSLTDQGWDVKHVDSELDFFTKL